MWSSIENLKENLNKIALDVHEDDEEEDDLHRYGSSNGIGDVSDSDRRNSSGFRSSRSVSRYPISNGIESPVNHEIERYKVEIKKLQDSEADIKALSVNYAALLREKEDQISRLNQENGSLKQTLTSTSAALKEARTDISRESNNNAIKGKNDQSPNRLQKSISNLKSRSHLSNGKGKDADLQITETELADMLESRTKSLAAVQAKELAKEREKIRDLQLSLQEERKRSESFKEEIESLRLDKKKTSLEISKVRSEMDAKLQEIKHLQIKLNGQESHAFGTAMEHLKEVNKALEKENSELKLKRSALAADMEESKMPTSSKVFPDATGALTRHLSSLDKEKHESFPHKEEMEQSLQRLETDLKETRRDRDKARQELKRLKQHLLEKETEESEKMDEDSRLIEELRQTNEYQRSQISQLEKTLKQAMANQEDNRLSNDNQIRKLKETVDDLNQKLTNCLRTIESKNVELLNLQTALGQYYAEIEAKEHFAQELAVAKDELMKLYGRLKDADERLESSKKEKEDVTSKLLHVEKVAAEWKNRVSKVEEDNSKVRRVLEQSMTRLNRMSMESDYLVDRRIVIKLLITYFQKNHSKEVLDLMVRMLGFSEEDKERIGVAQQGGGKGVVRGVLGFPGRFVGGILGGKSADSHANAASDNQSFADLWVDFLLKDAEERERREAEEAAATKARQESEKTRQDAALSDSEFSTVPLRSSESNQRLSRLLP
ncbi:hypothetical protein EUTSA_v10005812mg [Eutrema salsugineum]|uniref:GRIP domain-containing protein n=1 Tax=Eutrema salsugineum TaxID=72664 RepID=V4LN64_EUTSA|nr:golgin candidate 3 [Eutrema salsugineum]ESQ43922.1 hypothetical protein EUTSA_v10005812mg [Eutrema salsugineum]